MNKAWFAQMLQTLSYYEIFVNFKNSQGKEEVIEATITSNSHLKEWDDIGFYKHGKKLFCLAMKKQQSGKKCRIGYYEIYPTNPRLGNVKIT